MLLKLTSSRIVPSSSQFQVIARSIYGRAKIGNREVVGFGVNGKLGYVDHVAWPFPAVRFREDTPDIQALRQKEKGDWKQLSVQEKKTLYRASFCQTFEEMWAPTGEWKTILGMSLLIMAGSWWLFIAMKYFVYPPLPESMSLESRQAQLKRMIELRVDPVDGLASKWDYENNKWK